MLHSLALLHGVPRSPHLKVHSLNVLTRLGNNLAGQYKRAVGMAFHIGIGNFGGAIAANIYREQDSPRYILGRKSRYLLFPS